MPLLAHDRAGRPGSSTLVLLHAGVADRRMWDPVWDDLAGLHDVVRVDLRGFGASTTRPADGWSHVADVLGALEALAIDRAHVVGASLGAGVALELALARPDLVASLVLAAPGGSLIPGMTDELFEAIRTNPIVEVPTDFVLVARAFSLLSGIAHTLGHRANALDALGGGNASRG